MRRGTRETSGRSGHGAAGRPRPPCGAGHLPPGRRATGTGEGTPPLGSTTVRRPTGVIGTPVDGRGVTVTGRRLAQCAGSRSARCCARGGRGPGRGTQSASRPCASRGSPAPRRPRSTSPTRRIADGYTTPGTRSVGRPRPRAPSYRPSFDIPRTTATHLRVGVVTTSAPARRTTPARRRRPAGENDCHGRPRRQRAVASSGLRAVTGAPAGAPVGPAPSTPSAGRGSATRASGCRYESAPPPGWSERDVRGPRCGPSRAVRPTSPVPRTTTPSARPASRAGRDAVPADVTRSRDTGAGWRVGVASSSEELVNRTRRRSRRPFLASGDAEPDSVDDGVWMASSREISRVLVVPGERRDSRSSRHG